MENKETNINDIRIEPKTSNEFEREASIAGPIALENIFLGRQRNLEKEYERTQNFINYTTNIYAMGKYGMQLGKLVITGNLLYVIPLGGLGNIVNTENPILLRSSEDKFHPIVTLNFNLVSAKLFCIPNTQKFKISVLGYPYPFLFEGKLKQETFDTMINILNSAIVSSDGYANNLLGVSLRKDFFLSYFMKESEFMEKVNTGDILIFRGFGCPAKSQRCCTGAEYDHVALLLKRGPDVKVFEATSKDGCKERNWRQFIAFFWNLLYEKMVYRPLIIKAVNEKEKRETIQKKIEEFIATTEGKPYRLKACGLCCKLNSKEYERQNDWTKAKGFFCSQLAVASYLNAGIIKYNSDTRSYLPFNFSRDYNLPFNQGFELGPEYILEFSN